MKKRKKYGKVLLTFILVVSLFVVQGMQIAANATTPAPDLLNPTVIASNYDQFMEAVQNAQDGDVIGITDNIVIGGENVTIGSDNKHIYIVRAGEFGLLRVNSNGNLTMINVTVDGGGKPGEGPMIDVLGYLTLNNVTFQKCDANYGAIYVNSNGIAEINGCIFDSNYASSGGHIYCLYNGVKTLAFRRNL